MKWYPSLGVLTLAIMAVANAADKGSVPAGGEMTR
ncbi:hypothetical protein ALP12_200001 [Pseudomonas savastanoi pv. phaseolicola]|nr:hypothetical protein ALP12_200001 [Pseudomonas savastanoi pv. phaseolicola]